MSKYLVNHSINGYETVEITDKKLVDGVGNYVVVLLDESTNTKALEYYDNITNILISQNKLILVIVGKESKIRKTVSYLVANYRNYNIYRVDSKDTVNSEYIDTIIDREPGIDEVQAFVGGDVSAYADLNMILMGIDDIVSRGNTDELKVFVENHITSIENLTYVTEYMKKVVDTSNNSELFNRVEELKDKIRKLTKEVNSSEEEIRRVKDENLRLSGDNTATKQELARAMSKNRELESQMSSNAPVIQTYSELHTALINCRAESVIYFKEISYVPYANSLVIMLMEMTRLLRKKVKLIIYDSKAGLSSVYKPLSVIGGSEFVASKSNFISSDAPFVVVEPNPAILTSILESTNPKYDLVIVYDRMRQPTNLVSGNNVVKYYVINSSKDFKEVQNTLRITDKSSIITRVDSSIGAETLNIPTIPEYNAPGTTESAKKSKYKKLQAAGNGKLIINTILEKAHVTGR